MKKVRGIVRFVYLLMLGISFCLLFMSRSGEVYTVWEVLHPMFMPLFFVLTFLLLVLILSSEEVEYKLLFVIVHSVLSHTLFVIVFPAGRIGAPQMELGRTRLIFDNVMGVGQHRPDANILAQIYLQNRKVLQPVLSVTFAHMFGVDVYHSHLLLVPLLWGIFIPVVAFLITRELGESENVSALSGLLVSAFPATIFWGAESLPNSLGYMFFFCSLYFSVKYLSSKRFSAFSLAVMFSFISFLSHFLTGVMSFSLLLLAIAFKKHESEKGKSPITAKSFLLLSFVFCASLLPFTLVYHRLFYPIYTDFSLEKLHGLSATEMILLFVFGKYVNLDIVSVLIRGIGLFLGVVGVIYAFGIHFRQGSKRSGHLGALFLFLGLLMLLVDYRALKLFMTNIPFAEERLWLFRDFISVPFIAILIGGVLALSRKLISNIPKKNGPPSSTTFSTDITSKFSAAYVIILISLSGLVTASVYYAYPHWGPLQTASYELEATKHIAETTNETYIVICDLWMIYAGQMFVGITNPRAYYFSTFDSRGVTLFIKMRNNPSNETMIEAMKTNNSTTAYFIIGKRRLGTEEYNHTVEKARQNGLLTYKTFFYEEEEKLRIFYYKKSCNG